MAEVLSEALGIRMARETSVGVAPADGWVQLQPDVGGISGWKRTQETVERDIHSTFATMEKGDIVGRMASPTLTHDFNKDLVDLISESAFRCQEKHALGGTVSQWRNANAVAGVQAELDLDTLAVNLDTVIESVLGGTVGHSYTLTTVHSAGAPNAGTLSRIGTAFTYTYKGATTTVANFEAAVAALAGADKLIQVKTPGTGGNVLADTDDEFAATALAGGINAYFAVAAGGAVPAGTLIKSVGYEDTDNTIHVTTTGSDATHIYVSSQLVAETAVATSIDIAGIQFAAGDAEFDIDGNLITAVKDLETLGLFAGWRVKVGGAETITKFATADYNGLAYVKSVATNKITFDRRTWTPAAADDGAGKTIQLFFTRFYRNYPINTPNLYKKATLHGEKETPGAGSDGSTRFTYVSACAVGQLVLSAPLKSKVTATVNMVAFDATDPLATADRVAGPSTAYPPIGTDLTDTSNDLRLVRLADDDGTLIARINSWTLTINNNSRSLFAQGDPGAFRHNHGKFSHTLSMEAFLEDAEVFAADTANRSLFWDAVIANAEFGYSLCVPHVAIRNLQDVYAANEPVMLTLDLPAFRHKSTGIAGSLSVFAHYPPRED
jgi:hypothetical protein